MTPTRYTVRLWCDCEQRLEVYATFYVDLNVKPNRTWEKAQGGTKFALGGLKERPILSQYVTEHVIDSVERFGGRGGGFFFPLSM